jgi:hypothetical protein
VGSNPTLSAKISASFSFYCNHLTLVRTSDVLRASASNILSNGSFAQVSRRAAAVTLGLFFQCRAAITSNGCTSRSTLAAISSSAVSRS